MDRVQSCFLSSRKTDSSLVYLTIRSVRYTFRVLHRILLFKLGSSSLPHSRKVRNILSPTSSTEDHKGLGQTAGVPGGTLPSLLNKAMWLSPPTLPEALVSVRLSRTPF